MDNKFEKYVYWFNFDNKPERIKYSELVETFADETTTPKGVGARIHIRENKEYGTFDLWTWGHQGNNPAYIRSYDTEEEANYALYETFEIDMLEQDQYPLIYANTEEELIKQLLEITNLD